MKTIEDINNLIPILVDMVQSNQHEIGESYTERTGDGCGTCSDYADNYLSYEEDGWLIEISYRCSGLWDIDNGDYWTPPSCKLICAWGEVTEISAYHHDEDTYEETVFTEDDCSELWRAIDQILEKIA